jgi:uncharacterized membrane protein YeaQ/YmgE (transglycosylase-associated protein family)
MAILAWVILGGLAGWIASMIMGTNEQQGCLVNIIVGIAGAVIGGFIFSALGGTGVTGFNIYSLIVATIGAVVLLWIVRAIRRR